MTTSWRETWLVIISPRRELDIALPDDKEGLGVSWNERRGLCGTIYEPANISPGNDSMRPMVEGRIWCVLTEVRVGFPNLEFCWMLQVWVELSCEKSGVQLLVFNYYPVKLDNLILLALLFYVLKMLPSWTCSSQIEHGYCRQVVDSRSLSEFPPINVPHHPKSQTIFWRLIEFKFDLCLATQFLRCKQSHYQALLLLSSFLLLCSVLLASKIL